MRVRFVVHPIRGLRVHHLTEDDVREVLARLPAEVTAPLKEVHFNDRMSTVGRLGYATPGSGTLALCAQPERVSFAHYMDRQECTAAEFGAERGSQWPKLAVRRFFLYYVFLHELGHLQVLPRKTRRRGRVPGERMAREFGHYWRRRLWAEPWDHPDPVHRPPSLDPPRPFDYQQREDGRHAELIRHLLANPDANPFYWHRRLADAYLASGLYERAEVHYRVLYDLDSRRYENMSSLGICLSKLRRYPEAVPLLERALELREDPDVIGHLAICLWRTGQQERCEEVLREGQFLDDHLLRAQYSDVLRLLGKAPGPRGSYRWR